MNDIVLKELEKEYNWFMRKVIVLPEGTKIQDVKKAVANFMKEIETLDDEDWRVRGAAAWALGNLGDKKAIPALEKLLDDESGFVRQGAQSALDSIKK